MKTEELIDTFRTAIAAYKKAESLFNHVDALSAADPQQATAWEGPAKERQRIVSELGSFFSSYSWPSAFGGSEIGWDKGLQGLEQGHSLLVRLEIFSGYYSRQATRLGQRAKGEQIWSECGQSASTAAQAVMGVLREQIREFSRIYLGL
jgi:hypothetical protein